MRSAAAVRSVVFRRTTTTSPPSRRVSRSSYGAHVFGRGFDAIFDGAADAVSRGLADQSIDLVAERRWRDRVDIHIRVWAPAHVARRRHDPELVGQRVDQRVHFGHAHIQFACRLGIAQDVFEPTRQQRPIDRLGDEIGCASLERTGDRHRIVVTRHHDDGKVYEARQRAQLSTDLVAVDPRHVHVEQHDHRVGVQRSLERRCTAVEDHRLQAELRDRFGQQQPAEILVIRDDRQSRGLLQRAHAALLMATVAQGVEQGCMRGLQCRIQLVRVREIAGDAQVFEMP